MHLSSKAVSLVLFIIPFFITSCRGQGTKVSAEASGSKRQNSTQQVAPEQPVQYTYVIKKAYPHNPASFTQGLYWHDGHLWEGTGLYGESALQKVELENGRILERVPLDKKYFGEGIALLNGKIYQLTWENETAFVYDAATLEKTGEFRYSGEGWGLTTDGQKLYMSNGSYEISVLDPETFTRESVITVTLGGRRVRGLNELEWIDGRIWANVFMTDQIVIIDPATGKAEGVVDLEGILPVSERTPDTDVLNGIAYDVGTGRIFVTGKNWSRLFEIELKKKE